MSTGEQKYLVHFDEIKGIRSGLEPRPQDYSLVHWDIVIGENGTRPTPDGETISLRDLMIELRSRLHVCTTRADA